MLYLPLLDVSFFYQKLAHIFGYEIEVANDQWAVNCVYTFKGILKSKNNNLILRKKHEKKRRKKKT